MGIFDRLFRKPAEASKAGPERVSFSTPEERRAERVAVHHATVEDFSARNARENPPKAKRAIVRGKNYIYWVPEIEQLKRDGHLEDALDLVLECCRAAERDRQGREPAPAYTRHAAIICRKLGYLVDERRELERWISFGVESKGRALEDRLVKVNSLINHKLNLGISLDMLTRPATTIRGTLNES
ncbi:hypothetical protein [Glutamicibacter sp. AOP5-A2-18]|uniref:hypothetical protein n=1 Tax=Glutamicibacter sp. AOP5-A2-18 TaxID=3457656 RepID=UPI004033ADE0